MTTPELISNIIASAKEAGRASAFADITKALYDAQHFAAARIVTELALKTTPARKT